MRESARYSWRETLEEGKYQEGGEVEEKKEKKGEEEHPFVEVLPTEKDPNAPEKPKKKEDKKKIEEVYKGKHGQTDAQYADSRSEAGSKISGTSTMSGVEYTHGRRVKAENPGMQPDVGGKTKPKSQGRMDSGSRADLQYRKAALKAKEAEKKAEVKEEKRLSLKPNTNFRTEEMSVADQMALMKKHYEKNPPKKWQPGDRQKQRAAQMSAAQKKAKPDTRSDSEKMADATDERPGSFYRNMKR